MSDTHDTVGGVDYPATLSTKRMGAGMLFTDEAGRVLLVEPVYKDYWEIPGGAVEADESPLAAACREVKEELGLSCTPGRLLAVDWVSARKGRTEGLLTVFDGGVLRPVEAAGIRIAPRELHGYAFCTPDEARQRLSPLLARRVTASIQAREAGVVAYLENGSPPA